MQSIVTQEGSSADRLFGWWYRIAAPAEVSAEAPLRKRMRVRSGKLTSVIFLVEIIIVLANLIVDILDVPFAVPSLAILLTVVWVGVILNRIGKTTLAGILVLVILEMGPTANFFITPGGLSPFTLSIFDYNIQVARRRGKPLQAYKTGTSLDALIMEISKGIVAPQRPNDQPIGPNQFFQ